MRQRVAYGLLAIAGILGVVTLDIAIARRFGEFPGPVGDLLRRGSVVPVAVLLMMLRCAAEIRKLFSAKQVRPHVGFAYAMIGILVLSPWLSAAGWLGRGPAQIEGLHWQVVWLLVAVIGTASLTVLRPTPSGSLCDAGATLTMIVYLGFLASFTVQLRCGQDSPDQEGAWLLLITLLVTKASDIGGYLFGTRFGRHKLIPAVSPGKSVEGTAAGLVASAGVALLFVGVHSLTTQTSPPSETSGALAPLMAGLASVVAEATRSFSLEATRGAISPEFRAVLFGLAMSMSGQIGDLFESCFKRDAGTKDSGRAIPHYGGILDLVDSPILAVPVAWFLLTAVWNVV